jgi:hypothetical protein
MKNVVREKPISILPESPRKILGDLKFDRAIPKRAPMNRGITIINPVFPNNSE